MRGYLRLLTRDAAMESAPDLEQRIREVVAEAPGINEVQSIEPHGRGGYSVIIDRDDELPDEFAAHFQDSDYLLVI